eukprot:gene4268-6047_t
MSDIETRRNDFTLKVDNISGDNSLLKCIITDRDVQRRSIRNAVTSTSILFIGLTECLNNRVYAKERTGIEAIKDTLVQYDGQSVKLSNYLGAKGTLIVNVASQCALTPQYTELVDLYEEFHPQGFDILAFPCNQFGSQEPSPVSKIRRDMANQYGVKFPIFDKIDVNGPNSHPLYKSLKSVKDIGVGDREKVSWNFEKFLLNSQGEPIRRYKPGIRPVMIKDDVKELVSKGAIKPRKKAALNEY